MIENIQNLFSQLENKTAFIKTCADALGKRPNTLKQHWFREFWSIPEDYQEKVVTLLQKQINKQNKKQ